MRFVCLLFFVFLFAIVYPGPSADRVTLDLQKSGTQGQLGLHSQLALPVSGMYPEYVVQQSSNMVDWVSMAGPVAGSIGVSDELIRLAVPAEGPHAFYRVVANVKMAPGGSGIGDAVFGYGTAFSQKLQQVGQLSLDDFVTTYQPTNQYLSQITFDPTTAEFWNRFSIDPAVWNSTNSWWNRRIFDFRLNPAEFAVFQTNGFVVSQRLEERSLVDIYYNIYTDDLPVFVTADSILQAWHRSLLKMLTEIEETVLQPRLSTLLSDMSSQVPALWTQASGTPMRDGVLDADYFLAVANSLISGVNNYGSLGQQARVDTTLAAINNLQPVLFNLFGEDRVVDFSQFTVRGQYAKSPTLSRYFRALMWCALADFRYAGFSQGADLGGTNTLRELSGAVALEFLAQANWYLGQVRWRSLNDTLEKLVGTPDSLNLEQLSRLLYAAGIYSPTNLSTQADLMALQDKLMSGQLGTQQIGSGYYYSPLGPAQVKLPRSFAFMGQRFVMDSWAAGKCTFDNIIWDEDGIPDAGDKVLRRVPSALDVAFSVLGNSQVVPEIAARIARTNLTFADGRAFWRDGLPYQQNLAAVRNVIDSQTTNSWTQTIYNHWLACLRTLSEPTTDARYPEALRTRAWAMKTLNTQLASWTHLRYGTSAYVKEAYTPIFMCMYPKGYVEPRPAFWSRMSEMVAAAKPAVSDYVYGSVFTYTHYTNDASGNPHAFVVSVTGETMQSNRLAVLDHFIATLNTLRSISEKELSKTALSASEDLFLQHIVEVDYTGARTYTGWYPELFYQPGSEYLPPIPGDMTFGDEKGSDYFDALVTTVHTDAPDPIVGDPGSILHEAVGKPQLLMIAIDNGPGDLAVYGGPVLSHYEFELGPTTRLTDEAWKTQITNNIIPPAPDWTRSYLVPKP